MKIFPPSILAPIALSVFLAACGGPLPPTDPPYLAAAKDSLSRGNHWYERGCYVEAERFFNQGLAAARLSDDVTLIIRAQNSLGTAALASGDLNGAALYLERAMELSSAAGGRPEMDKILGNLGSLAYKAGRAAQAEEFWQSAIQSARAQGASAAIHLCNLARMYLEEGRPEFVETARDALAAAQSAGAGPGALADALNLAGHSALSRGDEPAAEDFFLQALEMDRRAEDVLGLAQDTEALGRLRLKQGRAEEAAGYLDRSFFLWTAAGEIRSQGRVYDLIKGLGRSQGLSRNMRAYDQARKNPGDYDLSGRCP